MLKAVKIRLYPNKGQQENIDKLLGCYRKVYNLCLDKAIRAYNEDGESHISLKQLGNYFHQELRPSEEYPYLREQNTKVLKQSIVNLREAYKNFFINGYGFPRFKSKNDNKNSARFPYESFSFKRTDFLGGRVSLIKGLHYIKFRTSDKNKKYLHKNQNGIKSATLTRTNSGKYFLSILVDGDHDKNKMETPENDIVGIDIGVKDFIVDSNGNKYENLKLKRKNHKKLARLHREISKKQKGSKNREKAKRKLAKYYEHLTEKKEHHLHSIVNTLIGENQTIAMENLHIKGMMKNHNMARSIQELSAYRFKEILKYKAEWYDRNIVEMDRWFASSKLCSNCGWKNESLTLNDRKWTCKNCGTKHDRDENAAKNIEDEGGNLMNNNVPTTCGGTCSVPIRDGEQTPLENCSAGGEHANAYHSTNSIN